MELNWPYPENRSAMAAAGSTPRTVSTPARHAPCADRHGLHPSKRTAARFTAPRLGNLNVSFCSEHMTLITALHPVTAVLHSSSVLFLILDISGDAMIPAENQISGLAQAEYAVQMSGQLVGKRRTKHP